MEAVILAGGRGTRLQPLTLRTPKPMLALAGVPFLAHQIARLRAVGVEHVVLATSYLPEVFQDRFGGGEPLGVRIDYVTEAEPLGTGGGIRNVAGRLEAGPDEDPSRDPQRRRALWSRHSPRSSTCIVAASAAATLEHLVEVDDARAFGCVPTDSHARVTGVHREVRRSGHQSH